MPVDCKFGRVRGQRCHVRGSAPEAIKRCCGDPQWCVPFPIRTRLVSHKLRPSGGPFPGSVPWQNKGEPSPSPTGTKGGVRVVSVPLPTTSDGPNTQRLSRGRRRPRVGEEGRFSRWVSQSDQRWRPQLETPSLHRARLIFETSKHVGVVYWLAATKMRRKGHYSWEDVFL